jgi:hypothetical protein
LRPALPILTFWWSALPIAPTVARHSTRTIRISPEGRRIGGEVALLRHELDRRAGRAAELAAAARLELHVVDHRADRHVGQRRALPA